jgi:DNA-binding NarL/FixJ family response regulator
MSDSSSTIRVLIVDDQHMVRSGFSMMLSVEDDVDVVGEAPNGQVALEKARELRPDVILMDVQMPVMDGIEATRAIVAEDLAKVLILTTFDRDDYVFDGLQAGASGFLLKNAGPEQLVDALRAVAEGHALLAPEVTRRVRPHDWRAGGPGAPHRPRTRGPHARGARPVQQRDRQGTLPRRGHGQDACLQHPGQAAPARPGPGRRLRLREWTDPVLTES